MARGVIFAVAYLTTDIKGMQKNILLEHSSDVMIDLTDGLDRFFGHDSLILWRYGQGFRLQMKKTLPRQTVWQVRQLR